MCKYMTGFYAFCPKCPREDFHRRRVQDGSKCRDHFRFTMEQVKARNDTERHLHNERVRQGEKGLGEYKPDPHPCTCKGSREYDWDVYVDRDEPFKAYCRNCNLEADNFRRKNPGKGWPVSYDVNLGFELKDPKMKDVLAMLPVTEKVEKVENNKGGRKKQVVGKGKGVEGCKGKAKDELEEEEDSEGASTVRQFHPAEQGESEVGSPRSTGTERQFWDATDERAVEGPVGDKREGKRGPEHKGKGKGKGKERAS